MKFLTRFLLIAGFFYSAVYAQNAVFQSPDLTWQYSDSLAQKNARNDSLLPQFDGPQALRQLFLEVPDLLSLQDIPAGFQILTKLKANLVFIDGTREEDYCDIKTTKTGDDLVASLWEIEMGVDFISGGSNTVIDHVRLCLAEAKEDLGLAVRDTTGEIVFIPSGSQEKELETYRVNADLDKGLQLKVLQTTQQVEETRQCPTDIDSYRMLLVVYQQASDQPADLLQIQEELGRASDAGRKITSCAYSREWNQRYSEAYEIDCDVDDETCKVWQSQDGTKDWKLSPEGKGVFVYERSSLLGVPTGPASVRDGGVVLDMKLIPLSKKIYLESYLDAKGSPVSLGLLILTDE